MMRVLRAGPSGARSPGAAMDIVTDFRTLAVAVAGLIALVAAGIVVARRMRPPAPPPPPAESVEHAPDETDAGYLDSSHIFTGSVLRTAPPDAPDGPTAGTANDGAPDRGGGDAARRP
jgi:hypothetical protein